MSTIAKSLLSGVYKVSGAMGVEEAVAQWTDRSPMAILLFHRVTDEIPEDGLTVRTQRFRGICRMLQGRFHVVTLAEVFRLVRAGGPFPRRTVAVTFDDCYHDNLAAARVLAEHDLPACFFVPSDYVGTEHTFPWDRHLKRLANLRWDEVRAIAALGHEIGSHTCSHADLGASSSPRARWEIVESKKTIEEQLERPVRWFAYPYGAKEHFRAELLPVVHETGYEGCLAGEGGLLYAGCVREPLPRVAVPPFRSMVGLELYLAGCLQWFYRLKRHLLGRALASSPSVTEESPVRQHEPACERSTTAPDPRLPT